MSVEEKLANVKYVKHQPLWAGPQSPHKNGGVTQGLLGKFIACPTRYYALAVEGLVPRKRFSHKSEYGTMFHLCSEISERSGLGKGSWENALARHTEKLCRLYPFEQDEVEKWYRVCRVQFPVYLDYWRAHLDPTVRTPLLQEQVFDVPYKLPSGRIVRLRGRWDAVEYSEGGIWLVESKTKGDVDEVKIARRLTNDLQTMLYLIAMRQGLGTNSYINCSAPIRGVRYNVVRRPLSGGKGTIKQLKTETIDQYYERLANYIREEPHTYFWRWQTEISSDDLETFEQRILIPYLERLCLWHEWKVLGQNQTTNKVSSILNILHVCTPFGVPAVTDEYGTEYDDWVLTGSEIGLDRTDVLFPELEGE